MEPKKYGLNELREMFLSFFESKGHLRLPSFSLIPQNNASLLQLNSGMAPMKPVVNGGGSDAAYTTRMGIPTDCSIGPCGWDVHTVRERSDVSTLPERAKLVAKCICAL